MVALLLSKLPSILTKNEIFYTIMHTTVSGNGDLVRRESSILRKRHSCWHGRKFSLETAASHNAVKLFFINFIA